MIKFFHALGWALQGIYQAFWEERNMKIHLCAAFAVIFAGWYFSLPSWQWIILILTIGLVFICEMVNTAVERVVNLCTQQYHPLAAMAKNVAAGSVLIAAIVAILIGGIIFSPYILQLLK